MEDRRTMTDVFHYDEEQDVLTISFGDVEDYDTAVRLYSDGVFSHQEDAYTDGEEYNLVQLEIKSASEQLPDEFMQQFLDDGEDR